METHAHLDVWKRPISVEDIWTLNDLLRKVIESVAIEVMRKSKEPMFKKNLVYRTSVELGFFDYDGGPDINAAIEHAIRNGLLLETIECQEATPGVEAFLLITISLPPLDRLALEALDGPPKNPTT
jgi:hypothetical protein